MARPRPAGKDSEIRKNLYRGAKVWLEGKFSIIAGYWSEKRLSVFRGKMREKSFA